LDREDGGHFTPAEHAYANDLDIFGKASVYQWLSRCYTHQGRQQLANNLLYPSAADVILARQEAVKELSTEIEWRQQWQAFSMQTTITSITQRKIQTWAEEEEKHFINPVWQTGVILYSIVTLASAIAAIAGYIPGAIFSGLFLLYLVISVILSRHTARPYNYLNGIVKETATLQNLIGWLEGKSFAATHILGLQNSIKGSTASAERELKALKVILDRFDLRASIIGILFLNPFLLWDVRQMIALNKWRQRNKAVLHKWFEAVAETELLHSLSTLHFNQPGYCFPEFTSQHFTLKGNSIGHPLLPKNQRVNNDFNLQGVAKIGLITGSNMAGKSTFLRSVGVNIVLAQMGSPVCAGWFLLSPVQLVSSMRIADNLAENTSTFYAELKKLRTIIELVKAHQPVFILLDEILRGTNSYDRHKGSAALIKQLIKEEAVAVIATHDVELAGMQEAYPAPIDNYHFDVEVEGEELYFDYKLKGGVCKSLNASILMKKIGIEIQE
jgi:DNA mismatch repair ATPase MutS